MSDGINHIRMEYEAKNLDKILRESKNLEEQNELLIKMVENFNKAIIDLQGNTSKSARALRKDYNDAINICNQALERFSTNATKTLQKQANDIQKNAKEMKKAVRDASNKDEMESQIQNLERLTKKYQENMRNIAKSRESMLRGKKNTPIEDSYLIREQQELQKEIEITKQEIISLYRTYNGATATGKKAIQHSDDAIKFTELNNQQRRSRDILTETQKDYDKLQLKVQQLTREYGSQNDETIKTKEALKVIVALREQETESLNRAQIELQKMGKLQENEGQDVQNRVNLLDQVAQKEREREEAAAKNKVAKQELLLLTKQQYEIESKIGKLMTNEKGKISEVSKLSHQNEIEALKNEKSQIEGKIKAIQKEYNFKGNVLNKIKEIVSEENKSKSIIEARNKDLQTQGKILGDTIKNFAKFTLYYQSLRIVSQSIQQAIDTMKELDKAFNDIRIVTQSNIEDTNRLAKEYNGLAKEMGSTTTEVAEGAVEWMRQGKTAEETTQLLKTSMTFAKVGAMESSQATELLTSTMNGYKFEVKDSMSVVDKMTAIDLEAATSTEELATALARTANMANTSGVSFEKLLGMIGTVSSVTRRSAETIRRSL